MISACAVEFALASLYFILFHIHTCWDGVVCLNTGMLPALAQQVMKNRQTLSDGFRMKYTHRPFMKTFHYLLICLLSLFFLSKPGQALTVGDKATSLHVEKWVNGAPVNPAKADGKTTYVIEFWATWCPPCRVTIPLINKLQEGLRDENVIFVSITDESESKLRSFMKTMKMDYHVATDTKRRAFASYMRDVSTIPYAFIVDKEGHVAWAGHPLNGMEESLRRIIKGDYTSPRMQVAEKKLQELLAQKKFREALKMSDQLIALEPSRFDYYHVKVQLLAHVEDRESLEKFYQHILTTFKDSAKDLNTLARMILGLTFAYRNLDVALTATKRATTLSEHKNSLILDTAAHVYYALEFLQKAIQVQKKAIALSKKKDKQDFQETLDYYQDSFHLHSEIKDDVYKTL